ncbi:MAG: hypothetical protein HRU46_20725 [Verrucomicrobiales bacterium]|nr:hypothetical protein [Verrucomicrobiales bacterium]
MSSESEIQSRPNGLSRSGWVMLGSLLLITVAYRLLASHYDFLGNTAPLMAIAFGGALLMGSRFWFVPVLLLVVSDLVLGFWHGQGGIGGYTLMSMTFYLIVGWIGGRAGQREKIWPMMWFGTLSCSVLFYVFANTYSWMMWPGYEKSLAGWWQSQTIGVPGINPPAWMFLRNALIADSIWCALAGLMFFAEKRFSRASEDLVVESA